MKPYAVYLLSDENGRVRYVGITKSPANRLKTHIRDARRCKTHRHTWINDLLARGITPTLTVVEWVENWDEAERRWIARLKSDGLKLVNGTDGGTSVPFKPSHERALNWSKGGIRRFPAVWRMLQRLGCEMRATKFYQSSPETIVGLKRAQTHIHGLIARNGVEYVDAQLRQRFPELV